MRRAQERFEPWLRLASVVALMTVRGVQRLDASSSNPDTSADAERRNVRDCQGVPRLAPRRHADQLDQPQHDRLERVPTGRLPDGGQRPDDRRHLRRHLRRTRPAGRPPQLLRQAERLLHLQSRSAAPLHRPHRRVAWGARDDRLRARSGASRAPTARRWRSRLPCKTGSGRRTARRCRAGSWTCAETPEGPCGR